jgi:alpha-methylacyl-CoA racemase
MPTKDGPLTGLRVLDLTRLLPGAFATALLADLGAEVIKVEQPGIGDPMRAYEPRIGNASAFTWVVDRNKRSVALNLRDPRGAEAALALAAGCDAVIESFRPGVAQRLGLGYEALRDRNPALVLCSISGYGADGPMAAAAGHDINYIGRAGLLSLTGNADGPAIPGTQVADIAGGSLIGLTGLLAALWRAQRTGEGDHVDVAMTDGAFALLALQLADLFATGRVPQEAGSELLTGGVPCYCTYRCADGRWLAVGALEPQFWQAVCERTGRLDLLETREDRTALPVWREVFAARPRDEWLAVFEGADACVGPVNDLAEAIADPQLTHRAMVTELEHPELGALRQLGTPLRLREHPAAIRTPAPELGEGTAELLATAGYTEAQIAALIADGAAARPTT